MTKVTAVPITSLPTDELPQSSGISTATIVLIVGLTIVGSGIMTLFGLSLFGFGLAKAQQTANISAAQEQLRAFHLPLVMYYQHMNHYPSAREGLEALVTQPTNDNDSAAWRGPYLNVTYVPLDPWGNEYQYELQNKDEYKIWSVGPDGLSATEDDVYPPFNP